MPGRDRDGARAPGEGSSEQATRAPATDRSWRPFVTPERLTETGSTNADLLEMAAAGAPEGTVVLADTQSAGRGRLGRRWVGAPGGSVLCSILFRPAMAVERYFLAGWTVALAASEACLEVAGVECSCKWPNDLLAGDDGRKLAGVLSEVGEAGALVVGIGLNCALPAVPAGDPVPPELASATSLERLAGRPVDRDAVAAAMLEAVARRWAPLKPAGPAALHAEEALRSEYRLSCSTIGQLVRVELAGEVFTGRALDVDDDGRLLVDVGSCIRTVGAGDVVHVRPGGAATAG